MPLVHPLRRVPLLGSALHRISYRFVPLGTLVPVTIDGGLGEGLIFRVDVRVAHTFLHGNVEPALDREIPGLLRPGQVVYDLGANIGYYALSTARLVGPEGRVFAFEPDPENARLLEDAIIANGLTNVTVVRAAAWSSTGEVTFERADATQSSTRGVGKVVEGTAAGANETVVVPAVALDDFVQEHPAPHFIKSDVEGAEVEVFRGAGRVLADRHPTIICEMHSPEIGERLTERFTKLGYRCGWLDDMHVLASPAG